MAKKQITGTTVMASPGYREEWLTKAADLLVEEVLEPAGYETNMDTQSPIREMIRVSTGLPKMPRKKIPGATVIGQTFSSTLSDGGVNEIFISPIIDNSMQVLGTLLHELLHPIVGFDHGHDRMFSKACHDVGLSGPALGTFVGENTPLEAKLQSMIDRLGPYPHEKLNLSERKTAGGGGTRMLKFVCLNEDCPHFLNTGKTVVYRATLAATKMGHPICGVCQERMFLVLNKPVPGGSGGGGPALPDPDDDHPTVAPSEGEGDGEGDGEDKPDPGFSPEPSPEEFDEVGDEDAKPSGGDEEDGEGDEAEGEGEEEGGEASDDGTSDNPSMTGGGKETGETAKEKIEKMRKKLGGHTADPDCKAGADGGPCDNCKQALERAGMEV